MTYGFTLVFVFQTAYFVVVARSLGASQFGAFAAAAALASVIAPFASLGSQNIMVLKTATQSHETFRLYFGTSLAVTAVLGSALVVSIDAVVRLTLPRNSSVAMVLPWVLVSELLFSRASDISIHSFQCFRRGAHAAHLSVLFAASRAIFGVVLWLAVSRPTAVTWGELYALSSAVGAVLSVYVVCRTVGLPRLPTVRALREVFRLGPFFAIGTASQTIYSDIDKFMLGRFGTPYAAGIYTGAYRIATMGVLPINAFIFAANPDFFYLGAKEPLALRELVARALKMGTAYAALVTAILFALAPALPIILGHSYEQSRLILQLLAPLPLIQTVHLVCGNALMGVGGQARRSAVQVCLALFNVGINLWLIPMYGWRGGVASTLATEGILAIAVAALFSRATRVADPKLMRQNLTR